jgi:hypothetical protein
LQVAFLMPVCADALVLGSYFGRPRSARLKGSQTTSLNYLRHHLRLAEVSNIYLTCLFEVRI